MGAAATENIVALCDVDEERSARGFAEYPNAKNYKDYRKVFESERKNIDAVMIATPDHMHTPVALLAMHLGKHVYCEKPLTRTPWEAQLLADAAVKYKVATQMGIRAGTTKARKQPARFSGPAKSATSRNCMPGLAGSMVDNRICPLAALKRHQCRRASIGPVAGLRRAALFQSADDKPLACVPGLLHWRLSG